MITEKAPSSSGLASGSDWSLCQTFSTISINSSFTSMVFAVTNPTDHCLWRPSLLSAACRPPHSWSYRTWENKTEQVCESAPPIHSYSQLAITANWEIIQTKHCVWCSELPTSFLSTLLICSLMMFLCYWSELWTHCVQLWGCDCAIESAAWLHFCLHRPESLFCMCSLIINSPNYFRPGISSVRPVIIVGAAVCGRECTAWHWTEYTTARGTWHTDPVT